jgi:hypothetical protein
MHILTDTESEQINGGNWGLNINNTTMISPQIRVATANQLNTGVNVSAFGGVNSNYSAILILDQFNGLIFN